MSEKVVRSSIVSYSSLRLWLSLFQNQVVSPYPGMLQRGFFQDTSLVYHQAWLGTSRGFLFFSEEDMMKLVKAYGRKRLYRSFRALLEKESNR